MCIILSNIKGNSQWNWDGDSVAFDTIIKAMRYVPEVGVSKQRYDIDIREFLTSQSNALMHRALNEIADGIVPENRYKLFIREKGAFDYRAQKVLEYVTTKIKYKKRKSRNFDAWLFPDETISLGYGDCEDRSFLLASLLIASGISNYFIRVALGYVFDHQTKKKNEHVWVMYRNEHGLWMILDPLSSTRLPSKKVSKNYLKSECNRYEYIPEFVFNDAHLWEIQARDGDKSTFSTYVHERYSRKDFWKTFNPEFGVAVHSNIFAEALYATKCFSAPDMAFINAASIAIDGNIGTYHPFDHFDNAYIDKSWDRVNQRLCTGNLTDFAFACHAVADFYAHTSYPHFFLDKEKIPIYPQGMGVVNDPQVKDAVYRTSSAVANTDSMNFDIYSSSTNNAPTSRTDAVRNFWITQGIISGRYAQPNDNSDGFFARLTHYPNELKVTSELDMRKWLPHHDEIAVDGETPSANHRLYNNNTYTNEFNKRVAAAIEHTKQIGIAWKKKFP